MHKILIIDDSEEFRELIQLYIKSAMPDYSVVEYDPLREGKPRSDFNWSDYDVLLLDYQLGNQSGLEWLVDLINSLDFPATIFLTAYGDEETAVAAMKLGVHEYLKKQNLTKEKLINSLRGAIQLKSTIYPGYSTQRHFFDSLLRATAIRAHTHNTLILIRCDQDSAIQDKLGLHTLGLVIGQLNRLVQLQMATTGIKYETGLVSESVIGLLLFNTGYVDIEFLAKHIVAEASKRRAPAGLESEYLTISLGITPIDADGLTADSVLANADIACRSARILGGNTVRSYPLSDESVTASRTESEPPPPPSEQEQQRLALKDSLHKGRFQLYFQPLATVNDSSNHSKYIYDVELRLSHGEHALRSDEYIQLADEMNLTSGILRRFMDSITALLKKLKPSVRGKMELLVNLPDSVLNEPGFWGWLLMFISKHRELLSGHLTLIVPLRSVHNNPKIIHKVQEIKSYVQCRAMLCINMPIAHKDIPELFEAFDFIKLISSPTCMSGNDSQAEGVECVELLNQAHKHCKLVVIDKITSPIRLANAIQYRSDYVQGDYIQQADTVIRKIDFIEEVTFDEPSRFGVS